MTTFEVEFEFWEKEEVTRTQIRRIWWLQNHWNTLFGQKFFHGDGSVTGSNQVSAISGRTRWTLFLGRGRFGDSNSTHYWSLWLSNVDQTSRDPSLWSHFRPFKVQDLPQQGSSSTLSRPSKNALCHI